MCIQNTYQSQFLADHSLGHLYLFVGSSNNKDLFVGIGRWSTVQFTKRSRLLVDLLYGLASCTTIATLACTLRHKSNIIKHKFTFITFADDDACFGWGYQKLVFDLLLSVTSHAHSGWSSAAGAIFTPSTASTRGPSTWASSIRCSIHTSSTRSAYWWTCSPSSSPHLAITGLLNKRKEKLIRNANTLHVDTYHSV